MKVILRKNVNDQQGIFEYLSTQEKEHFNYYLIGRPSSTCIDSTNEFIYVYNYSLQHGVWWSNNADDQYIEFSFISSYALQIENYSFVTHGKNGKYRLCGLVDWKIDYIFQTKIIATQFFHSDETHVENTLFHFPAVNTSTFPLITSLRLTMIGYSSRKDDKYLALNRFDIFGTLFDISSIFQTHVRQSFRLKLNIFIMIIISNK